MAGSHFCTLLVLGTVFSLGTASEQQVIVTGNLKCGDKPATSKDTWVRVEDDSPGINAKKEVAVNDDGSYKVTLIVNNAVFNLKPKLKIYTDCEDGIKPCQRKWSMDIPQSYVGTPEKPAQPFDAGLFNLEAKHKEEDRDCDISRSLGTGK